MSLVENNIEYNLIFLVGQSGSGKTSCGKILSDLISWTFIDTDEELILKHGKSINNIFKENGEEFFRSEELMIVKELIKNHKNSSLKKELENATEEIRQKSTKISKKSSQNPPKSSPGASKIEPGALQDAIFKRHLT